MPHLNNYQFMGHLGRAPELKQAAGKQLAEFSVAVSVGTAQKPDTLWVKCAVWGDRAMRAMEKLNKGDAVYVSGRLTARAYISKDKTAKAEVSVMVNEWQVLSKKDEVIPQFDVPQDAPQFASTVPSMSDDILEGIPF